MLGNFLLLTILRIMLTNQVMELWMNKKLNLFVLLLVVSALAFTSCKKDNNELTS